MTQEIKYYQPDYTSPFTPHKYVVGRIHGDYAEAVHFAVFSDQAKRGWHTDGDTGEEHPPVVLLHANDLFDTPEQAVEHRRREAMPHNGH